jgi:hypothetical protein
MASKIFTNYKEINIRFEARFVERATAGEELKGLHK